MSRLLGFDTGDMAKSHIKGYTKKDGTYVKPHERAGEAHHVPVHHPKTNDYGKPVLIKKPTKPSAASTWHSPDAVATFVPNGDVPLSINGIPVKRWRDYPKTVEGWEYEDGINHDLEEPPFKLPKGKKASAGVVIEESDGRVWIAHPSNAFGGYEASFFKGTVEPGQSLQGAALKEALEESGLKIEITGFIGDFERTTSVARVYRARRVGGSPVDCGWETQGVSLVPKGMLYDHLNMWSDHGIAEAIGAGPAPQKPTK